MPYPVMRPAFGSSKTWKYDLAIALLIPIGVAYDAVKRRRKRKQKEQRR